jgi:hypothetical protein
MSDYSEKKKKTHMYGNYREFILHSAARPELAASVLNCLRVCHTCPTIAGRDEVVLSIPCRSDPPARDSKASNFPSSELTLVTGSHCCRIALLGHINPTSFRESSPAAQDPCARWSRNPRGLQLCKAGWGTKKLEY